MKARVVEGVLFSALIMVAACVRIRVARDWVFAGLDSYGYVALAEQLWHDGRYALGPGEPPHYGRPPLYPAFLAVVKRGHPALMTGGEGWGRIQRTQAGLALGTMPVLYFAVRRVAGPVGALLTLALVSACPFLALYDATALSESLAASLTTLTLSALLLAPDHPRLAFAAAGSLAGLTTLTRPDGILLLSAFVPALFTMRAPRDARVPALAAGLAAFAVVYAPWPIRNLAVVGRPHFLGARVDAYTRPLARYHGWWRWIRSWAEDERPQTYASTCVLNPPLPFAVGDLPPVAFDSAGEQAEVAELLRRRAGEGYSATVDAGFEALGARRERRSFWRGQIRLPLQRAYHMWVSDFAEVLQNRTGLWPLILDNARHFRRALAWISGGILAATAVLLRSPRRRWPGMVLAVPIYVRTLVLSYANYSMPRYTVVVLPIALALIAMGAVEVLEAARGRRARPTPATA